jgi:hypothetical protein
VIGLFLPLAGCISKCPCPAAIGTFEFDIIISTGRGRGALINLAATRKRVYSCEYRGVREKVAGSAALKVAGFWARCSELGTESFSEKPSGLVAKLDRGSEMC